MRTWMLAVTLSLVAWSAAAQTSPNEKTGKSFVDRFATLDRKHWYISHGWANGPHQNCTWIDTNVRVEGSVALSLTDKPSADRPYTCAEIQTNEFYGYGTYEVRMRSVATPGTVSAFFTFTASTHGPRRPHDEIDFEFLGKSPTQVFSNYFANGRKHEQYVPLPFDATAAANDYAFEWTAEGIRWYANGHLVREALASAGADLPTTPQKIYLSIWNGTGSDQEAWLGRFAYPGRPLVAVFERVAFTEAGAPCQFSESVVCRKK